MTGAHLIVIEGIDGAGTSTQARLLVDWFRQRSLPVHLTQEPTSGPIGSLIRQVLTHRLVVPGVAGGRAPGWATMALLFAADRLDHLEAEIVPNLMDGVMVVCDRYDLSSIAYQSATAPSSHDAQATVDWVRQLNHHARRPDLTIVLDVDPQRAAARRQARALSTELYEDLELQQHLAGLYAQAHRLVPGDRLVHIDGNASVEQVHQAVVQAVRAFRGEGPAKG